MESLEFMDASKLTSTVIVSSSVSVDESRLRILLFGCVMMSGL